MTATSMGGGADDSDKKFALLSGSAWKYVFIFARNCRYGAFDGLLYVIK